MTPHPPSDAAKAVDVADRWMHTPSGPSRSPVADEARLLAREVLRLRDLIEEIRVQIGGTATIENPNSLAGKWLEGHDSLAVSVKSILDRLEKQP